MNGMRFCVVIMAVVFASLGCENGDWLGPVERGLRSGVNGWDMWATESVRPYENPMPAAVPGTRPITPGLDFKQARVAVHGLKADEREERAALTYRRFCHHCHGPNGDGRIIVGESLDIKPADLRASKVQSKTDRAIYSHIVSGGELMVPFQATMSPVDMMLAVEYVRTLSSKPGKPYFPRRHTKPIH